MSMRVKHVNIFNGNSLKEAKMTISDDVTSLEVKLSEDQMAQLLALCEEWKGPILDTLVSVMHRAGNDLMVKA